MTYEADQSRRQERKAADQARKQTMREQRERDKKARVGGC
jgi:hypothetical protein